MDADALPDESPIFSEVEFNITGLCNRVCLFCPRVDPAVFPNVNEHFQLDFYQKVLNNLRTIKYSDPVSYSGFGEPLLNRKHLNLTRLMREILPYFWLDIVPNGDRATTAKMIESFNAGPTTLLISNASLLNEKRATGLIKARIDELRVSFCGIRRRVTIQLWSV